MMHTKLYAAGCVALAGILASGCGVRARAETVPDGPPLAMPSPPSRVFTPVETEPLPSAPAVPSSQDEAPEAVAEPPPQRVVPPARPQEPPTDPVAEQPVPGPSRELRAASTQADAEVEGKVRALLVTAQRDLALVDYRGLTAQGREQYNQAGSFVAQASEAIAQRNLVFALTLADKAAQLAAGLRGR